MTLQPHDPPDTDAPDAPQSTAAEADEQVQKCLRHQVPGTGVC